MKTSAYSCTCGRRKQEANRWILGRTFALHGATFVGLSAWDDECSDLLFVQHFCSEQCAYKWLASELERLGR